MKVLLTDESNLNPSDEVRFFAYGGLVVDSTRVASLSAAIAGIREGLGLQPEEQLKFETRARPKRIEVAQYTAAKAAVIDACIEHDCRFLAYLILHDIARNRTQADLVEFGINTTLLLFDKMLVEDDEHGLVLIDRLPSGRDHDYLKDKFQQGLAGEDWSLSLGRIALFGVTADGASHLSSAVDIVLGAFRFCVNKPETSAAVREMLPKVMVLMHSRKDARGVALVRESGLALRPKEIRIGAYRQEYDDLLAKLTRVLNPT